MPQPVEVEGAHGQLLAEYQAAHGRLQQVVAASRGSDAQRLDQSLAGLRGIFDQLDADTRGYVSATIPAVYQVGAASTGLFTSWSQTSLEAMQALANQNYNELLGTVQDVEGTTRRVLRDLARAGALDVVVGGKPVGGAGRDLANLIQDAQGRVMTVTYANGAVHSLADWADTALRTQTALAYNAGAIGQYREFGIGWVELSDGADCGLTSHDDPEIANGLVVPLDVAEAYPLAHPRCGRSILPRPDIETADQAADWNGQRDPDELQRLAERERARAEKGTITGRRFRVDTETARASRRIHREPIPRQQRQPRVQGQGSAAVGGRVPRVPRGQVPVVPQAPTAPVAWTDAVTKHALADRQAQAAKHGMTMGEFRAAAEAHMRTLSDAANVYIRIEPDNLRSVLADGRFKTQFETGHSGGVLSPPNRQRSETALWGMPTTAPPTARPIYGYAAQDPFDGNMLDGYGPVAVRLKPGVKGRATLTVGDTLDLSNAGRLPGASPAPYSTPSLESVQRTIDPLQMRMHSEGILIGPELQPYTEVQIFGGVAVSDIVEVLIKDTRSLGIPMPGLGQLLTDLDAAGIPYRLVT